MALSTADNIRHFVRRTSELISFIEYSETDGVIELADINERYDSKGKVWPPVEDPFMKKLMDNMITRSCCSKESTRRHLVQLWILQLRFQCGLRGVKPSQLLGPVQQIVSVDASRLTLMNLLRVVTDISKTSLVDFKADFTTLDHLKTYECTSGKPSSGLEPEGVIETTQMEFLLHCFRRLSPEGFSLVYKVASALELDGDETRVLHLTSLLERYTGDADHIADGIVSQVNNTVISIIYFLVLLVCYNSSCLR